jgi:hypothetical protein
MPFYKRFLGVVLLLLVGLNVWFLVKVIREKSPVEDVRNFVTYYPPASRCIDDFCEKYNVKAGVATYWLSIFPEAYSRKNIKVKCVYSNGAPYYHNQHVNSYYRSSEGQVQSYEFFVAEKEVDSATVCRILGKPQLVERCANLTIYKFPPFRFSVFNSFPFMLNYDSSYYFMPCAHVDLKEIKRKSGITDTARGINLQPGIWLTTYVSRIDSTMNQRNMKVKFSCTLKPDTGTFSGVYIVFKHFNEEKYVSISQSGKTKNTGEPFEGLIYFDVPVTQPNDSLYVNIGNVSQTIVGLESLTFEFLK